MTAHSSTSALVVTHPGHELRIHGWLERAQPVVFVLTDGSGYAGEPRLKYTRRLLRRTGATTGAIFGRFADRQLYSMIFGQRHDEFCALADELAAFFLKHKVRFVVGDSAEGYNSGHDIGRAIIDAAVGIAQQRRKRRIESFAFPLVGRPIVPPPFCLRTARMFALDPAARQRKSAAAAAFAPLQPEIIAALSALGPTAFDREFLFPVARPIRGPWPGGPPEYERFGEARVQSGRYAQVLRYDEHVRPIAERLAAHAVRRSACLAAAS